MKLKTLKKIMWMIEPGAKYLLGLKTKRFFIVYSESTLGCTYCDAINEGLLSSNSFKQS